MKTFEQFIKEAVDFRLGGKANKGEEWHKSFEDLEKGDKVYFYGGVEPSKKIIAFEDVFEVSKILSKDPLKFIGKWSKNINIHTFSLKRNTDKPMHVLDDTMVRGEVCRVWTTFEMSKEELFDLVSEQVEESVDFRLGGSASKGTAAEKKFSELENGEQIFFYRFEKNELEYSDILVIESLHEGCIFHGKWESDNGEGEVWIDESNLDKDIQLRISGIRGVLWTTYQLSEEEAKELYMEARRYNN